MLKLKRKIAAATFCSLCTFSAAQAGEVEVLHFWTSGGEAKSVAELKKILEEKGHTWKDFSVSGGGGDAAMTVLKSRAVSGNPPSAAQVKGPSIQEWGDQGVLADVTPVAEAGNWDKLLPGVVADVMKYEGKYVAAPVNVHRVNWMWVNPAAFKTIGSSIPTNWDDFFVAADKLKKAGIIPVAHGGQPWQDFTIFETVVLGVGGADLYNKVFVELDKDALNSAEMVTSFQIFKRLKSYMDPGFSGRDWNVATGMIIDGKAAVQFMGDWAKGEFTAAGKKPGEDFLCLPAPGTDGAFTFNIDSFIFFEQKDKASSDAQGALAASIMEPRFQEIFNLNKGSIPARLNIDRNNFDSCATSSMDQFISSAKDNRLVPSVAHGMAAYDSVKGAMQDVVTNFFNSNDMNEKEAAKMFATQVANAKAEL
jgi:glucose/mannose transport system substrate-binding protein